VTDEPLYRVTLRPVADPVPGGRPVEVRLRWFLKTALRSFGLRAVAIEEVPSAGPKPAADVTIEEVPAVASAPSGKREESNDVWCQRDSSGPAEVPAVRPPSSELADDRRVSLAEGGLGLW
jgi:hypothetical protein